MHAIEGPWCYVHFLDSVWRIISDSPHCSCPFWPRDSDWWSFLWVHCRDKWRLIFFHYCVL